MGLITYLISHYTRLTLNTLWTIISVLQTAFILILIFKAVVHPPPTLDQILDIILLVTYICTAGFLFVLMVWAFRRTSNNDAWGEEKDEAYQQLSGDGGV